MDSCEVHICTFVATLVQLCHVAHWIYLGAEKQRKRGRPAVQAEEPSAVGLACVRAHGHHMHSNSSMRCLVLPERICLRVLYLSRPAFMFSAWMTSLTVFLLSSRALANSELKAWEHSRGTATSNWANICEGCELCVANKFAIFLFSSQHIM